MARAMLPRSWLLPACLLLSAVGCGGGTRATASTTAAGILACDEAKLRVNDLGRIELRGRAKTALWLYDVEGCDAQTLLWCRQSGDPRCAPEPAAVMDEAQLAAADRALDLRRTKSRARCAPETVRVAQQSESLWTYEACDGTWEYHCRAHGCEALRPAR